MLWTDLRILIVDTGRVWWRLLPMIMGVYLLGWLGSELTLRVAVIAGDISPWLALVLFAFNFVCVLAAAIVILSLAGRELGIRELLPADEREIDDRDTSLSRLVAITLLPFLAMYAAFGQVAEAANRLVTQQWVRYGFLSDQQTVLGALYDLATRHLSWLVALPAFSRLVHFRVHTGDHRPELHRQGCELAPRRPRGDVLGALGTRVRAAPGRPHRAHSVVPACGGVPPLP